MTTRKRFLIAAAAIVLGCPLAHGQTSQPTSLEIRSHVVKPVELVPTDELIAKNIKLPDGFKISKFAKDLLNARMLCVNDNGDVYVTRREQGDVLLLRDTDNDGMADVIRPVLQRPMMHGITIHKGKMYLATVKDVYVADIQKDGSLENVTRIIDDLPDGGQHPNRTLTVGPDERLYISVGSTCNACDETNPENATILRATLDGKSRTIFASGLRNTIGFGWTKSGRMWGVDHGIDWLGDNDQPEEVNELKQGKAYGWPYIYANGKKNPQDEPPGKVTMDEWKKMSTEPTLLYTAHSSPLQLAFYNGTQFPKEYQGNAFIVMRGSWNRMPPSGYEVARIRFDEAGNATKIEPFVTGWLVEQGKDNFAHMGRLAGCAVAKDGSLLISDDKNGVIYRISYAK